MKGCLLPVSAFPIFTKQEPRGEMSVGARDTTFSSLERSSSSYSFKSSFIEIKKLHCAVCTLYNIHVKSRLFSFVGSFL